jgi:hypothetical protein
MRPLTKAERQYKLSLGTLLFIDQGERLDRPYQEIMLVDRGVSRYKVHTLIIATRDNPGRVGLSFRNTRNDILPDNNQPYAFGLTIGPMVAVLDRKDLLLFMDWHKGKVFEQILKGE